MGGTPSCSPTMGNLQSHPDLHSRQPPPNCINSHQHKNTKTCSRCGYSGNTSEERRLSRGKTCKNCKNQGHLKNMFQTKTSNPYKSAHSNSINVATRTNHQQKENDSSGEDAYTNTYFN